MVVAAGFEDVDLPRGGPGAVGGVDGEHPDGGPQPVATGEAGGDFDAAVFDGEGFGVQAAGFDGGDDGVVGEVGGGEAVVPEGGGAGVVEAEVDGGVVGGDESGVLEGGFDVEHVVGDKDVFVGGGGLFELAVAETADFGFFGPDGWVEAVGEGVVQDGAVGVVDDGFEAVPDEESGDGEASDDAEERDDGYPFLAGVVVIGPGFGGVAFLDSAGVKVVVRGDGCAETWVAV